ncbi:MAG TPA: hypothetical protein VFO10_18115 [Oligoflexus sp.]|uniref:hypothetical protein n=1 Tax=Oligoflexus sp. TaxID=1971216 RepID=UPI002D7E2D53|nr:hypothetical protein [Oligoflexus sp.]HET9239181.1 hypothetical protein [Oligoflexus sp.]
MKQSGRAPIHQFEVGGSAFDLDPTRADFEYTLLELVKKTVEPAFTYRYRNGKTHIPGPDSYRTIQVLAAGFIDEHGPNKLADFGTWLSALRENRGERILLENWSSLVSRWASGESPEHPDIIEQRAEEARRSTEEFQRDLAAVEAEKEARRLAEEAQIQKAKELREARDQAILGLDFQEVLTRCLATRRMGTWNRKKAVSGGSIEALVRLSRENVEFRSVFDQVLQEMLPDYLATPPMQAFAVFSEVTF